MAFGPCLQSNRMGAICLHRRKIQTTDGGVIVTGALCLLFTLHAMGYRPTPTGMAYSSRPAQRPPPHASSVDPQIQRRDGDTETQGVTTSRVVLRSDAGLRSKLRPKDGKVAKLLTSGNQGSQFRSLRILVFVRLTICWVRSDGSGRRTDVRSPWKSGFGSGFLLVHVGFCDCAQTI